MRATPNAHAHFLLGQVLRDEFSDYVGSDFHYRAYLTLEPNGENAAAARVGLLQKRDEALVAAEPTSVDAIPVRVKP